MIPLTTFKNFQHTKDNQTSIDQPTQPFAVRHRQAAMLPQASNMSVTLLVCSLSVSLSARVRRTCFVCCFVAFRHDGNVLLIRAPQPSLGSTPPSPPSPPPSFLLRPSPVLPSPRYPGTYLIFTTARAVTTLMSRCDVEEDLSVIAIVEFLQHAVEFFLKTLDRVSASIVFG